MDGHDIQGPIEQAREAYNIRERAQQNAEEALAVAEQTFRDTLIRDHLFQAERAWLRVEAGRIATRQATLNCNESRETLQCITHMLFHTTSSRNTFICGGIA